MLLAKCFQSHPYKWRGLIAVGALAVSALLIMQAGSPASRAAQPALPAKAKPERQARPVAYRSPGKRHKLRVHDAQLASALRQQGARLVANYGSFQILSADEKTAAKAEELEAVEWRDEENLILLNAGPLDTTRRELQSLRSQEPDGEVGLRLVQFAGPVKPEWYAALEATGVEIVAYVPHNAYLVFGPTTTVQEWAAGAPYVQWDGVYQDQFKLDPDVRAALHGSELQAQSIQRPDDLFAIQLVRHSITNQATLQLIAFLQTAAVRRQFNVLNYLNVIVRLPLEVIEKQLAARPDVISIKRYIEPTKRDERQAVILTGNLNGAAPAQTNYLDWLTGQGFTPEQFAQSNFAINVTDSGIDNATTTPGHFALYTGGVKTNPSRVVYNRLEGTPNAGSTLAGCDGHGTINAHIIAGFIPAALTAPPHVDASGFRYGLGIAPFVKVGSTVIFDPNSYTFPDLTSIEARAYQDGARISSNSWGAAVGGEYTIDAQTYDALVRDAQPDTSVFPTAGNQEMVIVFAAGNAGPRTSSIGTPGTGKNVLTVGAAESVLAVGGNDGCFISDAQADSANDIANFSSRGPTTDGRRKPDLVAPGTHVTGGVAQSNSQSVLGQALACYNGGGVCGGLGGNNFFPSGQQFYTISSGTSHATPAAAGAAALLRQRFINAGLTAPSPAMTKAALMNTAQYMSSHTAGGDLWSNAQGMGAINLTTAFNLFSTPTILRDQRQADIFTATGQTRLLTGTVADATKPFRVTLAWTDAPGSTTGNAYVNDLNLEVTIGGQTYRGNVFSGQASAPGGAADGRNNVESVFIPAGVAGAYVVKVTAANIAGDGVPGSGAALDQDFALVANNGLEGAQPVLSGGATTLVTESCGAGNGVIDPGETVTINLPLQNIGTANTTNLMATLQATGGVTNPGAPQSYGALNAGGAAVSRSFTFTATGVCGGALTVTLALQDSATNLGVATFNLRLGTTTPSTATFINNALLTIPAGAPAATAGWAAPYPANINVTGLPGTISKVTVKLHQFNHTAPDDVDILLVAPDGRKLLLMSDAGGTTDAVNLELTFDDAGVALPDATALVTGAYSPTNFGSTADSFSAPAPTGAPPEPQRLSTFNGALPNGTWSLYVMDDGNLDVGSLQSGWSLTITTAVPSCCSATACPTITVNPLTISNANVGTVYSQSFTQMNGTLPINFSVAGALPPGLSLTGATLAGTPTQTGNFSFTILAIDANSCIGSRSYTLSVACPTITINPVLLPAGRAGVAYNQTLTQIGGSNPVNFSVSGVLPNGLTLASNGELSGTPTLAGSFSFTVNVTGAGSCAGSRFYSLVINPLRAVRADFDGDGRSDISLWRGTTGNWYIYRSIDSLVQSNQWGAQYLPYQDIAVPADYDGDGKTDVAVWRPLDGFWYIINSATASIRAQQWGTSGDTPVPADYDGDGKTDIAVWRGTEGVWYIWRSTDNTYRVHAWGTKRTPYQDIAVPADYDGDGKADIAVWRPYDGYWYIINSATNTVRVFYGGRMNDTPVPADYDGDGKTDPAVWRGAEGNWYIWRSSDNTQQVRAWGAQYAPYNDVPIPADYDGDGKADLAVWRPFGGNWYIIGSANGAVRAQAFGQGGDTPIPKMP